ncbi:MAG: DUF4396 domain-containing protein [Alphaproteobacteria bacterium]
MEHNTKNPAHDCCSKPKPQNPHEHGGHKGSAFRAAAHATLHCLTGCVIGEVIGLAIGVSLGLHPYTSMALSTILAYISGFSLTIFPLMHNTGLTFKSAFHAIWLGEVVSIGVMELIMNSIDYHMGGMRSGSVMSPLFWEALAVAIPAGYIAAFPVNAWLIKRQLKKCH